MRIVLFLIAALGASFAQGAYRCVDEKGTTHVGDVPPPACANVPVYEVSRTGNVIKRIDPTLTPEQVKAKNEAAAKAKEEEKVAAEQKRKDLALIATYSNEKDIDIARDRNVDPVKSRIANAQDRGKAIDKRMKELEEEMEFYKSGPGKGKGAKTKEVPPQLLADHERLAAEKSTLAKSIAGYEREVLEISARYAADKARWTELKTNPTLRGQVMLPANSSIVERQWTRGQARCGDKMVSCRRGESYFCLLSDGRWTNVPCEAPKL